MNEKVVILCGGMGTRLEKETEYRPKPMVEIGGRPILWHIMKIYSHYGFKDFVLCLGYKGDVIRNYFSSYHTLNCDFTVNLKGGEIKVHHDHDEGDWNVTLAETGAGAMTGSRIKKIEKYIDTETFMVTYGDGLADIDIGKLLDFHLNHKKIGTLTGVYPPSRFGEMITDGQRVMKFVEKPRMQALQGAINGGFFVFNKKFFKYLSAGEDCVLERAPLENLAKDGELMISYHEGFWQCVDTRRDLEFLNNMWARGEMPWKKW